MTHEQIHTHAVFINNRMVLGGDAVSARIVFKNLTGQNFRTYREYARYLKDMEMLWKTDLRAGDLVELRNLGTGQNEKRQQAGTGLPESEQAKLAKATTSLPINWAI